MKLLLDFKELVTHRGQRGVTYNQDTIMIDVKGIKTCRVIIKVLMMQGYIFAKRRGIRKEVVLFVRAKANYIGEDIWAHKAKEHKNK